MLYYGKGGSNSFIPGSDDLQHEGRGDRAANVTETIDTTNMEKTETGKGVFSRNVLNKVEE